MLYAATGIILARELSQEDFGLVGAITIFQAFAALIIDSGFSSALLQRKNPSRLDYSTVLWFNLAMAAVLYCLLFLGAPLIARCFQDDQRLIGLSRGLFAVLILNASAIVQTNILMKRMDVRMVAVSNSLGLILGGVTGIALAINGAGAWALVWQTLVIAAVKSLVLWTTGKWRPLAQFSWTSLRSFSRLALHMTGTSFLNTLFLNIYGFFIGNRVGLVSLGYYSQSDKWSKMATASLSQVLTSTFVPALAAVQDQCERFAAMVSRINRFTAYLLLPLMLGMMVSAKSIFHVLFGEKWDPSIILFQLLLLRGIFVVLNSLYGNYLLAAGKGHTIMRLEILRDALALGALLATLPFIRLSTPESPVLGLEYLLWGQLGVTLIAWGVTLVLTSRVVGLNPMRFLLDIAPYAAQVFVLAPVAMWLGSMVHQDFLRLIIELSSLGAGYIVINILLGSKIQREVWAQLRGRKLSSE